MRKHIDEKETQYIGLERNGCQQVPVTGAFKPGYEQVVVGRIKAGSEKSRTELFMEMPGGAQGLRMCH